MLVASHFTPLASTFYFNYPILKTMTAALLSEAHYVHMYIPGYLYRAFWNLKSPKKHKPFEQDKFTLCWKSILHDVFTDWNLQTYKKMKTESRGHTYSLFNAKVFSMLKTQETNGSTGQKQNLKRQQTQVLVNDPLKSTVCHHRLYSGSTFSNSHLEPQCDKWLA